MLSVTGCGAEGPRHAGEQADAQRDRLHDRRPLQPAQLRRGAGPPTRRCLVGQLDVMVTVEVDFAIA